MGNLLVRGLSIETVAKLKRIAAKRKISLNQLLIQIIAEDLLQDEEEKRKKREWDQAFQNVDRIRERLAKYGKFEDSTKLIREDRDSR